MIIQTLEGQRMVYRVLLRTICNSCLLFLAVSALLALASSPALAQTTPDAPLPAHCKRGGPLPLDNPNFCGCTWGVIYYRGQPVVSAPVTLRFNTQITETLSIVDQEEPFPFYDMTGAELGAQRGDVMTVTTTFGGQTASRTFRAQPNAEGEQQVNLVLPQQGIWSRWLTGGYTRTLAINGTTLWAGGVAGVRAIDTASTVSTTQTLPWPDPVVALAIGANNHVWAAAAHQLAEFDGNNWQNRPLPFAATIRALTVDPASGALWAGGGDNSGALAVYDGAWHPVTAVGEQISTLTVDSANHLWVGTLGGGVYRHTGADPDSGWTQFKVAQGLASNFILAATAADDAVWFGTRPYLDGQASRGGVSRYNLAQNNWRTYGIAHGLPADVTLLQAPAAIYALTVDGQGGLWAGTPQGVYQLATPAVWVNHLATGDAVRALAAADTTLVAARTAGLDRLDPTLIPGNPPTVQLDSADAATLSQLDNLTLHATAADNDPNTDKAEQQIMAWDWQSDRDGPLCTTANSCLLSGVNLTPGSHTISVRVQDDEGVWSQSVTTKMLLVTPATAVYLPLVQRPLVTE